MVFEMIRRSEECSVEGSDVKEERLSHPEVAGSLVFIGLYDWSKVKANALSCATSEGLRVPTEDRQPGNRFGVQQTAS